MVKPHIMISSDGTPFGTYITDGDGKTIRGVTRVIWDLNCDSSKLSLEFADYPVQIMVQGVPQLIKMSRWSLRWPFYLTADVLPQNFGLYYSFGYRIVKW